MQTTKLTHMVIASISLCISVVYAAETKNIFEGRYEYRSDAESLEMRGKQVCFFPSKPSSKNISRPVGDNRMPWFCFTNSKQAAQVFGFELNDNSNKCGFKGNATIRISNYKRYAGEGDDNDVARLDGVLKSSKPVSLPCFN